MEEKSTRAERKKGLARQHVVGTAMRLFKANGVEATTMEQIAAAADIAKGTLYHYFPVKEAIISEYMQQVFRAKNEERLRRFRELGDTRARVEALFSELLSGIGENREIFERYMVYRMRQMASFAPEERMKSGFNLLVLELVRQGIAEGGIRDDIPPPILEDMLEFAFVEAVKLLYSDRSDMDSIIRLTAGLFLNGVQKIAE